MIADRPEEESRAAAQQPGARGGKLGRMRSQRTGRLAVLLAALALAAGCDPGADGCDLSSFCSEATPDGACRHALTLRGGGKIYYYANYGLSPEDGSAACRARFTRAVLVQHGTERNPWDYADFAFRAAEIEGAFHDAIIIAPYFMTTDDLPPAGFQRWSAAGWKSGDAAEAPPHESSFAVYDALIRDHLLDASAFPSLAEIVIAGHSAGGQFCQRYALSTFVDRDPAAAGVAFRFVPANPSAYCYLDATRWLGDGFGVPSGTGCDETYDDYKYGLSDIPEGHYVAAAVGALPGLYADRDVTYLLGTADTTAEGDLEVTCEANVQGPNRYARGLIFESFMGARYPGHRHALVAVAGVGHDAAAMLSSAEGRALLFR